MYISSAAHIDLLSEFSKENEYKTTKKLSQLKISVFISWNWQLMMWTINIRIFVACFLLYIKSHGDLSLLHNKVEFLICTHNFFDCCNITDWFVTTDLFDVAVYALKFNSIAFEIEKIREAWWLKTEETIRLQVIATGRCKGSKSMVKHFPSAFHWLRSVGRLTTNYFHSKEINLG